MPVFQPELEFEPMAPEFLPPAPELLPPPIFEPVMSEHEPMPMDFDRVFQAQNALELPLQELFQLSPDAS